MNRTGIGYDIHRLDTDRPLYLGGIRIPFDKGLVGHSDADVLIHAIIDALLGAAGLPDIGSNFPDNDNRYKNINSKVLLQKANNLVKVAGYQIVNIDSTVICEKPKLKTHIPEMKAAIASSLNIETERINIKATTHEGFGPEGRGEAISAMATVLLTSKNGL
ncbi:MAG: 2-C-methyl-D-erythritol 2,4-cyclodiphosphate synthase [Candidatus Zixiibacteriota bacterium]